VGVYLSGGRLRPRTAPRRSAASWSQKAKRARSARSPEDGSAEERLPSTREELLPDLVSLLKRLKAESFKAGHARHEDFVFATEEGRALLHRNVSRDFDLAAERAGLNRGGLPKVTCHSLRRTAFSRWIAAGDDAQTIAREAGDNIETIMGSYAGDFEKAKRRQDRLERLQAGTSISLA
jgi:integrase